MTAVYLYVYILYRWWLGMYAIERMGREERTEGIIIKRQITPTRARVFFFLSSTFLLTHPKKKIIHILLFNSLGKQKSLYL